MNTQKVLMFAVISGLASSTVHAQEPAPAPLTVTAETPVVTVEQHPPGRHFLSLPTLEYAFEVVTQCGGEATPASLSINVADSRVALSAAELAGIEPKQIALSIPAKQIAPIAVSNICVIDDADARSVDSAIKLEYAPVAIVAGPERSTVSAALSAQVSLLCSSDSGQKITYVTQPLAVTLACAEAASKNGIPENQGATDR